jgi:hypothetical protein
MLQSPPPRNVLASLMKKAIISHPTPLINNLLAPSQANHNLRMAVRWRLKTNKGPAVGAVQPPTSVQLEKEIAQTAMTSPVLTVGTIPVLDDEPSDNRHNLDEMENLFDHILNNLILNYEKLR